MSHGSRKGAPGKDIITKTALSHLPQSVWSAITGIYDASLRLGCVPRVFKQAIIQPVKKPTGHRPISLLPVLSKLLERIVLNRLHFVVQLPHNQFGRPGCTPDTAVRLLHHQLLASVRARKPCCVLFMDISKAFDTTHPLLLIDKLDQRVPDWMKR